MSGASIHPSFVSSLLLILKVCTMPCGSLPVLLLASLANKRTAIDLSVIKHDLRETSGIIRWIDTRAMLADPLTKCHPGDYLRYVMDCGRWPAAEACVALQRKALECGQKLEPVKLMVASESRL